MTAEAVAVEVTGRAWVFRHDYINTDAIMPRAGYDLPPDDQDALVLATLRPGWSRLVRPGDVLVAGRNFGTGSSRPAVSLLRRIGIAAIVAESVAEVFFRNCVSYAMPAMDCRGVLDAVEEGDIITVDPAIGLLSNRTKDTVTPATPVPAMLLETVAAGGVYEQLRRDGYM